MHILHTTSGIRVLLTYYNGESAALWRSPTHKNNTAYTHLGSCGVEGSLTAFSPEFAPDWVFRLMSSVHRVYWPHGSCNAAGPHSLWSASAEAVSASSDRLNSVFNVPKRKLEHD